MQLELVNVCNYRCPLCRTLKQDGVVRRRMSLEELERLLEPVVGELREVTLFGTRGEPFLHPELERAVALIRARSGAETIVSTNGSRLTPARARAVLEAGLDRLVFAVDGLSQETYGRYRVGGRLEQVLANLAYVCQQRDCGSYRTKVVFQLIPMAHNEHELERVAEVAYGLGVDEVRLKVSSSVDRDQRYRPAGAQYRASEAPTGGDPGPLERAFTCPFGLDKLYVDPNGDCYPCCYAEGRAAERVGNALESSLLAVWRGEALRAYRAPFSVMGERDAYCVATCARRGHKRKLKLAAPG
ncbi:MAG: radical SAM/SPASM domain-containing protein [Planctomycetota bacterium]